MALEIWIPESARPKPPRVFRCKVPGCDVVLPADQKQQFIRHVTACVKRRGDEEIQRICHERVTNPFLSGHDKEQIRWVKKRQAETGKPAARGGRAV